MERRIFDKLAVDQKQNVVLKVIDYNGERLSEDCRTCAACCVAFSVPNLKDYAQTCPNLISGNKRHLCGTYEKRPKDCKLFDCEGMKKNTPLQKRRLVELISCQEMLKTREASGDQTGFTT